MLLGFGYLYKIVMFCFFFFFFKKQKIMDYKNGSWSKFCNIIFLFLLKIGLVGPADQQIKVSPDFKLLILAINTKRQ